MNRNLFLTAIFLCFTAIVPVTGGENLTAGISSIDITPPLSMKYTLGGYGVRMNKPAEGIHDRIWAKALALKKGDRKYALITLDILGLPSNVKTGLVDRISGNGWNMENVMLLPSHSHGSLEMNALNSKNLADIPQIGIFQPQLLEFLLDKLETLMKEADRDYQPVRIGTKSRILEGLNRNRRKDPDLDRELTVTRVDLTSGKPLAVLVNWTAHPTMLGASDMKLSAEWPGSLQHELERLIGSGVTAMFYNGAEGDQSYIIHENGDGYRKMEIYGKMIAEKAFEVYNEIKSRKVRVFSYNYNIMKLPGLTAHPSFMKTGGMEYGMNEESVQSVLSMLCPSEVGLGAVKAGDLVIASVPGEMTAVLGMKIKKAIRDSGVKHPTIGGLASEWISYILSYEQYVHGEGYESSMSFYGPGLGELITSEIINTALQLTESK